MGAGYSHTNRPAGTTLTETIYNQDHQNHIDNATPSLFDDYSSNTAQMRSTADPGEGGSENLPTSLAGELERLRFVLLELKTLLKGGTAPSYWYTTIGDNTFTRHSATEWTIKRPDGLIEQGGFAHGFAPSSTAGTTANVAITFNSPFPNGVLSLTATPVSETIDDFPGAGLIDSNNCLFSVLRDGLTGGYVIALRVLGTNGGSDQVGYFWHAIGW